MSAERATPTQFFVASASSTAALGLECSPGVQEIEDVAYERDTYVAREPWKSVGEVDLSRLGVRVGIGRAHDSIGLVTLPSCLLDGFHDAFAEHRDGLTTSESRTLGSVLSALADWLESASCWKLDVGGCQGQGFVVDRITRRSATKEAKTGRFVGLHIDSWDRAPLDARRSCQNRLCVNLGAGARAFQFIPVQADELWRRVIKSTSDDNPASLGGDVIARFMRRFPEQPVLRMRLDPGQAYIAPTENLIHDGCTLDDLPDLTYVYRGRIDPRESPTCRSTEQREGRE